ncbi:hypothetical protein AOCH_007050 [Aspergillus ochraceoroseus]|nr:hypothetical protein AOCH_007050 [Aspergillus ochraceoroseus]
MSLLQNAFNSFLFNIPPKELEDLLKHLQNARAQEQRQPPPRNENPTNRINPSSDTVRGPAVRSTFNSRSTASRGRRIQDGKRRPLNSFIAFRSFYSVIFPDLTQKAKSGILRFLWQNDPFKAKWTILAKAYSIIRDDHDTEVALESFLNLNANVIGVPEPSRYLDAMGWQLNAEGPQQYTMARIRITTPTEAELSTNYSVSDIINHCYAAGYVSESTRKNARTQDFNAPVMAFAAQPTSVVQRNNSIQISGNHTRVKDDLNGRPPMEITTPDSTQGTDSPNLSDMSPLLDEASFEVTNVPAMYDTPQSQEPPVENVLDLENMELPNWYNPAALMPYNEARLMQETLETFDFNPFLDI